MDAEKRREPCGLAPLGFSDCGDGGVKVQGAAVDQCEGHGTLAWFVGDQNFVFDVVDGEEDHSVSSVMGAAYSVSERRMTSVSVSPLSAARSCAGFQMSSAIRIDRSGVLPIGATGFQPCVDRVLDFHRGLRRSPLPVDVAVVVDQSAVAVRVYVVVEFGERCDGGRHGVAAVADGGSDVGEDLALGLRDGCGDVGVGGSAGRGVHFVLLLGVYIHTVAGRVYTRQEVRQKTLEMS